MFPFQANGSMMEGPDGKPVVVADRAAFYQGRVLSAAPVSVIVRWVSGVIFGFGGVQLHAAQSRRDHAGSDLKYKSGPKAGQLVASDIEAWFQQDQAGGQPHIVAQWADAHNSLAQGWVTADPTHGAYVDEWGKKHPTVVAQFIKDNPGTPEPKAPDLAVVFFETFSKENPGRFPSAVTNELPAERPRP